VTQKGAAALTLVRELKPVAVTLDLHLPDLDGWQVLNRLKVDLSTRHIPVHIITVEEDPAPVLGRGALGFATKSEQQEILRSSFQRIREFVTRPVKELLRVEQDQERARSIREMIGNGDVNTTVATTAAEALEAMKSGKFDCMVLDPALSGWAEAGMLEEMKNTARLRTLPVLIYPGRDLPEDLVAKLRRWSGSVLARDVPSPEALVDETALLLHRPVARLPERQRKIIEDFHHGILAGRKALLVDDDIRNIFAMTSLLERFKMRPISAENGQSAIQILMDQPDIAIVLMDIMLPTMDGYATIRAIRELPQFKHLPIIAVTAKAMKGDREKCIAAGASDYLCKPVEAEQLRATIRLWLHR